MNWREAAKGMLENERKMLPLHQPPSTPCLVRWRGQVKVGCIQWPVDSNYIAIVYLAITSLHSEPEYIRAIKNLDPNRLELQADADLDLTGTFHVLHRVGIRLTHITPEEADEIARQPLSKIVLTPTERGFHFDGILYPKKKP